MPMTEAQALKTWCPHAIINHGHLVAIGDAYADGKQTMLAVVQLPTDHDCVRPACVASHCQMWDWDNRGGADRQYWEEEAVVAFAKSSGLNAPQPPAPEPAGHRGLRRGRR